jgi:hypothetical protein
MVKLPPHTRACLYLHGDIVCYGILYKRDVIIGSKKEGQIWVKIDTDPEMDSTTVKDIYLRDTRIMKMDVIYDKRSDDCCGLFNQCICETCKDPFSQWV